MANEAASARRNEAPLRARGPATKLLKDGYSHWHFALRFIILPLRNDEEERKNRSDHSRRRQLRATWNAKGAGELWRHNRSSYRGEELRGIRAAYRRAGLRRRASAAGNSPAGEGGDQHALARGTIRLSSLCVGASRSGRRPACLPGGSSSSSETRCLSARQGISPARACRRNRYATPCGEIRAPHPSFAGFAKRTRSRQDHSRSGLSHSGAPARIRSWNFRNLRGLSHSRKLQEMPA